MQQLAYDQRVEDATYRGGATFDREDVNVVSLIPGHISFVKYARTTRSAWTSMRSGDGYWSPMMLSTNS
jgi:hypothetical protein